MRMVGYVIVNDEPMGCYSGPVVVGEEIIDTLQEAEKLLHRAQNDHDNPDLYLAKVMVGCE